MLRLSVYVPKVLSYIFILNRLAANLHVASRPTDLRPTR